MTQATPEEFANEYCDAIENAPNGHGQFCHPVTGERSDYIMRRSIVAHGAKVTSAALDVALKERGIE